MGAFMVSEYVSLTQVISEMDFKKKSTFPVQHPVKYSRHHIYNLTASFEFNLAHGFYDIL